MTNKIISSLDEQRELKSDIAELSVEKDPSRDLWPAIVNRLEPRKPQTQRQGVVPWAVAATLVMSVGLFALSWHNYRQAEAFYAQATAINDAYQDGLMDQLDAMEREYRLARTSYLSQIQFENSQLTRLASGESVPEDIASQLVAFQSAAENLKAAIRSQPSNPNLPRLLKATYQQELSVLSQLARLNKNVFSEERI